MIIDKKHDKTNSLKFVEKINQVVSFMSPVCKVTLKTKIKYIVLTSISRTYRLVTV